MKSNDETEFERLNFKRVVPAAYRAMLALESYVHPTGHCVGKFPDRGSVDLRSAVGRDQLSITINGSLQ